MPVVGNVIIYEAIDFLEAAESVVGFVFLFINSNPIESAIVVW